MTEGVAAPALASAPSVRAGNRVPIAWWTAGLLAVVIAFGNGFWFTSLHGAIGAIERTQGPFTHWLVYSTIMVPVEFGAVVLGYVLARRWIGERWRPSARFVGTALLIVATTTAASIAEVSVSSAYDYHLQSKQLAFMQKRHDGHAISNPTAASQTAAGQAATLPAISKCNGLCDAQRSTLAVHLRAITYASVLLLITNLVLVAWVLALRGGKLWARTRPPALPLAPEAATPSPALA